MFKNLLKQSWQTAWQYPVLWIFGLFSALIIGNEIGFLINNFNRFSRGIYSLLNNSLSSLLKNNIIQTPLSWWGIFIVFLSLFIILIVASLAQIALINGWKKIQGAEKPVFKNLLKQSWSHLGSVLFINLLMILLVYLVFTFISLPFAKFYLKSQQQIWFLLYFLINLIVLLPISWLIYFLTRFTIINFVLYQQKLSISIVYAWQFIKQNWLKIIGLSIILGIINLFFALILVLILTTTAAPLIILTIWLAYLKIFISFPFIFLIILSLIVIIFIFLESLFVTFQNFVWILFYHQYNVGKKSE